MEIRVYTVLEGAGEVKGQERKTKGKTILKNSFRENKVQQELRLPE